VTIVQRFGGALNLNIHFHMLVPGRTRLRGSIQERSRRRCGPG
jgi:hypothetical protein